MDKAPAADLKAKAEQHGLTFDAMNSNTFQDHDGQAHSYKFGSLSHTDAATRAQPTQLTRAAAPPDAGLRRSVRSQCSRFAAGPLNGAVAFSKRARPTTYFYVGAGPCLRAHWRYASVEDFGSLR